MSLAKPYMSLPIPGNSVEKGLENFRKENFFIT
jgi:hypothetical protein